MTHNLAEATKIYEEHLAENPNFDHDLVIEWKEEMPEEFSKKMYEIEYGCHIVDEDLYQEAVKLLKWGSRSGAKWTVDEISKLSKIDFDTKPYYEMDFAYMVNRLYSDFYNIFSDATYYFRMAQNYLEDEDYCGKADERAYHDAIKRIKYHKQKALK